jgi:DnaD/phage-associated family protein
MNTLVLKNKFRSNATLLTNEFIDEHMPKANGEFIKVYLFLLRHIDNQDSSISIPAIADHLNNTETDIIRAIKYWENQGLLILACDSDENIVHLELPTTPSVYHKENKNLPERSQLPDSPENVIDVSLSRQQREDASLSRQQREDVRPSRQQREDVNPPRQQREDVNGQLSFDGLSAKPPIPFEPYKAKKSADELKTILHITELYLGKPISSTEAESIIYLYEDLDMSADLIEYLIGTCVDNGNKSISYINKVAFDWHDKGIRTVKEAKVESRKYNKIYSTVLNAFGIINRGLAKQEINYIDKWINQYSFNVDIIEEACDRTIYHTSQPNFKYADSILKGWFKNNVSSLEDIYALDKQHEQESITKRATELKANGKSPSKDTRKAKSNFVKREDFDYDSFATEQIKARIAARKS